MTLYVGNDDAVTQKVKKAYIGIEGVGKEIKAMYVGDDNGIARKVFPDGGPTPPAPHVTLKGLIFYSPNEFKMKLNRLPVSGDITYSTDGENWETATTTNDITSKKCSFDFNEEEAHIIMFKASGVVCNGSKTSSPFKIVSGSDVSVGGKMTEFVPTVATNVCSYLFDGLSIVNSNKLKLYDTLANYCYSNMYNNCTNLISTPELSAINLKTHCYSYMFNGCKKLQNAPGLPAVTLQDSCYEGMFKNCIKLDTPPQLSSMNLATECYRGMFEGCDSLTTPPNLPATKIVDNAYHSMFKNSGVTTTVDLTHVTTFTYKAYDKKSPFANMYRGTKLTHVPSSSYKTQAKFSGSECICMFADCTLLTSIEDMHFKNFNDATAYEICASMFSGCTSLVNGPNMHFYPGAQGNITRECFSSMFEGCTALTTAGEFVFEEGGETWDYYFGESVFWAMYKNCSSLLYPPDLTKFEYQYGYGYMEMFAGCTSLKEPPHFIEGPWLFWDGQQFQNMCDGCEGIIWVDESDPDAVEWHLESDTDDPTPCMDMFVGNSGDIPEGDGTPIPNTSYYYKRY